MLGGREKIGSVKVDDHEATTLLVPERLGVEYAIMPDALTQHLKPRSASAPVSRFGAAASTAMRPQDISII